MGRLGRSTRTEPDFAFTFAIEKSLSQRKETENSSSRSEGTDGVDERVNFKIVEREGDDRFEDWKAMAVGEAAWDLAEKENRIPEWDRPGRRREDEERKIEREKDEEMQRQRLDKEGRKRKREEEERKIELGKEEEMQRRRDKEERKRKREEDKLRRPVDCEPNILPNYEDRSMSEAEGILEESRKNQRHCRNEKEGRRRRGGGKGGSFVGVKGEPYDPERILDQDKTEETGRVGDAEEAEQEAIEGGRGDERAEGRRVEFTIVKMEPGEGGGVPEWACSQCDFKASYRRSVWRHIK